MLQSSMNFAFGFFGHPIEKQYQQLIMVHNSGARIAVLPLYLDSHNGSDRLTIPSRLV